MDFDIKIWWEFRDRANKIGSELDKYRDENRKIGLLKQDLDRYIERITEVLKECSSYMDSCGLKIPSKYNNNSNGHLASDFICEVKGA